MQNKHVLQDFVQEHTKCLHLATTYLKQYEVILKQAGKSIMHSVSSTSYFTGIYQGLAGNCLKLAQSWSDR